MTKTVFITGASSGIGRETALYFKAKGWSVVATVRDVAAHQEFFTEKGIYLLPLDVNDASSVDQAVRHVNEQLGGADVVVNNAGYGLVGVFESSTEEQLRQQFETNFFGTLRVMRAFLPHFRKRRQGVIVNVTSIGGRFTMPLYSAYHASKFALEGFSESIQYELAPFNIKVKMVEPGPVATDFAHRSAAFTAIERAPEYAGYQAHIIESMTQAAAVMAEPPSVTAEVIFRAAEDTSWRQRFISGTRARLYMFLNWLLPETANRALMVRTIG